MDLGNGWLCILMGYLGTSSFERGYIVLNDRLLMNKELGTSGKRKIVTRFQVVCKNLVLGTEGRAGELQLGSFMFNGDWNVPNSAHSIDVRRTFSALFFNYATTRACNGILYYMVVFSLKGLYLKRRARSTVLQLYSSTAVLMFLALFFLCRIPFVY